MAILATEAVPIAAEALGGGEAAAAGSAASGGAGRAVGSQAAKVRQPAAPTARKTGGGTSKRSGGKGGKKSKGALAGLTGAGPKLNLKGGGGAHKLVIAEFILCVVMIGLTPILMRKPDNGHLYVPNDFVRLTAVCLLFFALALLSNSPRSSKFAAAFGGLVTLGVIFNASGSIKVVGSIFTNAGTHKGQVQTAAAGSSEVKMPAFSPTDPTSNPMGGTVGGSTGSGTVSA